MKCRISVEDWIRNGISIYNTEEGFELSIGDLHSGTTWPVDIVGLPDDIVEELMGAAKTGAYCEFLVRPELERTQS